MSCKYMCDITKLFSYKYKNKLMMTCKYKNNITNCIHTIIGIIILVFIFEYM